MDEFDGKFVDTSMHFVLGENEHTIRLANSLAERGEVVTLIDSKYRGMKVKGDVTYANMKLARGAFDLPNKLYFHAYMDPKNRKTPRKYRRK